MNEIRRVQELAIQLPDVTELARKLGTDAEEDKRALKRGVKALPNVAKGVGREIVESIKRNPGKSAAAAAGVALGVAGGVHVHRQLKMQQQFQKTARDGEYLKIADQLYIDRHGAMFPATHPRIQRALNDTFPDK